MGRAWVLIWEMRNGIENSRALETGKKVIESPTKVLGMNLGSWYKSCRGPEEPGFLVEFLIRGGTTFDRDMAPIPFFSIICSL